ncbi:hypothetical protein Z947_3337 [Sulfitobacter geojensis]|nr:hypothetical protein Z947_3337 [Sulfitobacter geojensis]
MRATPHSPILKEEQAKETDMDKYDDIPPFTPIPVTGRTGPRPGY